MPLAESPTERGKEKDQKVDDIERKKQKSKKKENYPSYRLKLRDV